MRVPYLDWEQVLRSHGSWCRKRVGAEREGVRGGGFAVRSSWRSLGMCHGGASATPCGESCGAAMCEHQDIECRSRCESRQRVQRWWGERTGRKGGEDDRIRGGSHRSSPASWRICVTLALSLSLLHCAMAQSVFYDGEDALKMSEYDETNGGTPLDNEFCNVATPPAGSVIPVSCKQNGLPGDPFAVECDAVSFTVVTNQTAAKKPQDSDFKLPDPSKFDETGQCTLPGSSLLQEICGQSYAQKCQVQSMQEAGRMLTKTYGYCKKPKCKAKPDERPLDAASAASCDCTDLPDPANPLTPIGTCECFHWQRYNLKPTRFMSISDAKVCFSATLRHGGNETRCVHLDINVAPYGIYVEHLSKQVTSVNATVGQKLELAFFASDINTHQTLEIALQPSITSEKPSVELPQQRWVAPAECINPKLNKASMTARCVYSANRALWQRKLEYTPEPSEDGMKYQLFLTARDNGINQAMLTAQYKFSPSIRGVACGQTRATLCSPDAKEFRPVVPSIDVYVQQVQPVFEGSLSEFTPPEGPLPRAYPNCPMMPVNVRVWKPLAALEISLTFGSTPEDVAAGRHYASPDRFAFTSVAVEHCVRPTGSTNQHLYRCAQYTTANRGQSSYLVARMRGTQLQWTPPLEAAGFVYKVCVVARDLAPRANSASVRCWTIEVQRCMYCTDSESIAHLATRFRTSWLQIWSANDAEWVKNNAQSLAASNVDAWDQTEFPHKVEKGTLVRLGPVYKTRAEHSFEEIAHRFSTSLWALVEMNPDLADLAQDAMPIPIGQEVCILPGICTPAAGSALDEDMTGAGGGAA